MSGNFLSGSEEVGIKCEVDGCVETVPLMSRSLLVFVVFVILSFSFTLLLNLKSETADEGFHTPQIWEFYNGNYNVAKELTMLPAYHAVMAGMLKVSGFFSIQYARFCHLLLAMLCIPVFYRLCRSLDSNNPDLRTLIFMSVPLILPFFSLLYTDIPALLFVLLMVYFGLRQQYFLAAVFSLAAISMRQTNLIWLGFVGCVALANYFSERGIQGLKDVKFGLWPLFLKLSPYALVLGIVGVFFLVNGSVAVGDSHQHNISINLSNLYFLLMLGFFIFLPYNLAYGVRIYQEVVGRPKLWVGIAVMFVLYMATYSNSHQYNSFGLSFYLRNILLHYTVEVPILRFLAFIPVMWMLMTLYMCYVDSRRKLLLGVFYVFAALSVVPLPLIEQRYYIVALTLFVALKPAASHRLDMVTLFLFVPMNCVLLFGISRHYWFL